MKPKREKLVAVTVTLKPETLRRYREWSRVIGISMSSLMRAHLEKTITPLLEGKK